jgi:hypothetical protein
MIRFSFLLRIQRMRFSEGTPGMVGGLSPQFRVLIAIGATALVGALTHAPARAADLGGDCCADLEERVAELEAMTVR